METRLLIYTVDTLSHKGLAKEKGGFLRNSRFFDVVEPCAAVLLMEPNEKIESAYSEKSIKVTVIEEKKKRTRKPNIEE
jgi:hypothetical protein